MATRRRFLPKCALAGAALVLLASCEGAPTDGDVTDGLPRPSFAVGAEAEQTARLTNVLFEACNALSLGYELDGVRTILESRPFGCTETVGHDHTITYRADQTLRLFLRDDSCNDWIFYEDGPHGLVVGVNPYEVIIGDAFIDCSSSPEDPRAVPNLKLTKTITGRPASLLLTPPGATNPVGATHCVTATVLDDFGNPVSGVTVFFSVGPSVPPTFPNPSRGEQTTDERGQARFCYTASLPGVDRIHAFADANGDGREDPIEDPSGNAAKTWTLPANTELCEVTITDGGWIIAKNADRASFGGNAKVNPDGTVQGQQQYQDQGPVQPMNVHSIELTATTCSDDRTAASIFGRATIDGAGEHVFHIDVTDGGSGGSNDTYGILLDNGYMSGQQRLGGGNVTIHKN
jgi:Big-like domain-containing protein